MRQSNEGDNQIVSVFSSKLNPNFKLRVIRQYGEYWFNSRDLFNSIGIHHNKSQCLKRLDPSERIYHCMDLAGIGTRSYVWVNESGLYHLIYTSKKECIQQFRRWIIYEVIAALRLEEKLDSDLLQDLLESKLNSIGHD